MTFTAKFVLEEAPKSRRHIELFFGRVGLRLLVEVNALLVTQVFKFSFPANSLRIHLKAL